MELETKKPRRYNRQKTLDNRRNDYQAGYNRIGESLTNVERYVFEQWLKGVSGIEIGKNYPNGSVSKQRVHQIINRVKSKINQS